MSTKPAAVSAAMQSAIDAAKAGGENRLYRWPGGYWMPRRRVEGEGSPAHGTYQGTQTVRGLLSRGLAHPVELLRGGDPWVVELTSIPSA